MGTQVKPDYVLTPLPDDGTRGYRLELDEFIADNDVVNIFLIALTEMQKDSLTPVDGKMNLLNYYALGAIHGLPKEDWNNYPNNAESNGKGDSDGYCHHSLDTFPTWHRPYMALYERALFEEMVKQADKYTDASYKARYHAAAQRFRLPYFDPIMPRYKWAPSEPEAPKISELENVWGVPEILRTSKVWVREPKDPHTLVSRSNPLYSFEFPSEDDWKCSKREPRLIQVTTKDSSEIDPTGKFNPHKTARAPNEVGETDNHLLEDRFKYQGVGLATGIYQMLSPEFKNINSEEVNAIRGWSSFANSQSTEDKKKDLETNTFATVSIESWHDDMHGIIGEGGRGYIGQMCDPAVAGFDPMFWMHHNNIDRLLSLRQALYGMKDMAIQEAGKPDVSKQELKPFAKSEDGTCWTSSDPLVADYWSPGFAVPGNRPADAATIKTVVSQYLTHTYFWATSAAGDESVLRSWPQPMQYSEALRGTKAEKREVDSISVTAIATDPKTGLVYRKISTTGEKSPLGADVPIPLTTTVDTAGKVNDNIPPDAFKDPGKGRIPVTESWNAHIRVRKFAFNGSFSIHLFIGDVQDDKEEEFYLRRNEVGFSNIFAPSTAYTEQCPSCQTNKDNDIIYEDVIALSVPLIKYLESTNDSENPMPGNYRHRTITSLEPSEVRPFLKEHLRWRIVARGGRVLSRKEQEAQLEVKITSRDYIAPSTQEPMGKYGEIFEYKDITENKPGGYGYVYQ